MSNIHRIIARMLPNDIKARASGFDEIDVTGCFDICIGPDSTDETTIRVSLTKDGKVRIRGVGMLKVEPVATNEIEVSTR